METRSFRRASSPNRHLIHPKPQADALPRDYQLLLRSHQIWYIYCQIGNYAIPDTISATIPWVLSYIWKARNDKIFNGKEISPLETIQIVRAEAESWRVAHIIEQPLEEVTVEVRPDPPPQPPGPICSIDASWHKEDTFFGGGMVLTNEDGMTTFGSFTSNRVLTPLHAEFQTLLWAMKSSIQLDHSSMTFETDGLQLVNLLEEDEEDK
ncbi:hypothetical protein DY000_02020923 [Brassica cretica]|uniref:RNase H type-1 domain-containing protein n=1 Tax=Brassica cretica TaxID=69181 RepID=A0ABQ7EG26_BRACR|nr:hypothetical protein DY000_02020923 [Brassica cretica]